MPPARRGGCPADFLGIAPPPTAATFQKVRTASHRRMLESLPSYRQQIIEFVFATTIAPQFPARARPFILNTPVFLRRINNEKLFAFARSASPRESVNYSFT